MIREYIVYLLVRSEPSFHFTPARSPQYHHDLLAPDLYHFAKNSTIIWYLEAILTIFFDFFLGLRSLVDISVKIQLEGASLRQNANP